jgi:hypothetical protein
VSAIVLLDAGPLGMVTNSRSSLENEECKDWFATLVLKGTQVVVSEIADSGYPLDSARDVSNEVA